MSNFLKSNLFETILLILLITKKMKLHIKNIVATLAMAFAMISCDNDDTPAVAENEKGSLKIEFDNIYGGADLAFATNYTNSNGEVLQIDKAKYIVSNIVLTKTDGSTYTVPKTESYFIVDEATAASTVISLPNIPAGDYASISFGIGVDQAQWELGVSGQGNFWAQAQDAGMEWGWTAGYRFLVLEGTFTTPTDTTPTNFQAHTGRTSQNYNYTTISLNFPTGDKALVRNTITPQIHVMADFSKVLDGVHTINLSEGAGIHGGSKLTLITENLSEMFEIHHVHND